MLEDASYFSSKEKTAFVQYSRRCQLSARALEKTFQEGSEQPQSANWKQLSLCKLGEQANQMMKIRPKEGQMKRISVVFDEEMFSIYTKTITQVMMYLTSKF